jgi:hypothetical protein
MVACNTLYVCTIFDPEVYITRIQRLQPTRRKDYRKGQSTRECVLASQLEPGNRLAVRCGPPVASCMRMLQMLPPARLAKLLKLPVDGCQINIYIKETKLEIPRYMMLTSESMPRPPVCSS